MKLELPAKLNKTAEREWIRASERAFEAQLDELVFRLNQGEVRTGVVSLCGPSCSGKTTTASKIIDGFKKHDRRVITLSVDGFYKDRYVLEAECDKKNQPIDLESIDAIDVSYLGLCFERMLSGKEAMLPVFDFTIAERVRYIPYSYRPGDVILLEGIQTMYPTVREMIGAFDPFYIFIDAQSPLETDDFVFTGRDLRFVRRLVRDFYRRGASAERTFDLWDQVTRNEDKAIYPFKDLANFKIDSTMSYEPMLFRKHLPRILGPLKENSVFYESAQKILDRHQVLPDFDEKLLPKKSVFHEFL